MPGLSFEEEEEARRERRKVRKNPMGIVDLEPAQMTTDPMELVTIRNFQSVIPLLDKVHSRCVRSPENTLRN